MHKKKHRMMGEKNWWIIWYELWTVVDSICGEYQYKFWDQLLANS